MQLKLSKTIKSLILLLFVLGGLPFLIYFIQRSVGYIPDMESWYDNGINHGPWRSSIESITLYYPLALLIISTLIIFILNVIKKKWQDLLIVFLLLLLQCFLIFTQIYYLSWLID